MDFTYGFHMSSSNSSKAVAMQKYYKKLTGFHMEKAFTKREF